MLDQQLSQNMGAKGIGVADMMLKQLMRNAGGRVRGRGGRRRRGARAATAARTPATWPPMNAMAKAYANAAGHRRHLEGIAGRQGLQR